MRRTTEQSGYRAGEHHHVTFGQESVAGGGAAAAAAGRRASSRGGDVTKEDAAAVLKEFDGKMKAITDLLQGYQAERTAQAKGLPVQRQGREREGTEQGEQQGPGGGGGSGAGPRRRGSRPLTATAAPGAGAVAPGSEEFFLQLSRSQPRRVRSAAPGASRTLSTKIDFYRTNPELCMERAEKAREVREAQAAAATAGPAAAHSTDFVDINRRGVVPYALPYGVQVTIESLRDQGLSGLRKRSIAGPGSVSGPAGGSMSGGGSAHRSSASRPASAVPLYSSSGHRNWSAGQHRTDVQPSTASSILTSPSRPGSGAVHPSWSGRNSWGANSLAWPAAAANAAVQAAARRSPPRQGSPPAAAGPGGDLGSVADEAPWPERGASGSNMEGRAGAGGPEHSRPSSAGPGLFLTAVDVAAGAPHHAGQEPGQQRAHSPPPVPHLDLPRMPPPSQQALHHTHSVSTHGGPTSPGSNTHGYGPGSTASAWTGSPTHQLFYPDGSSTLGEGSLAGLPHGVTARQLRLALSARPASGGSPTSRVDFIAEHVAMRAGRAVHLVEVRERAAEAEAARRRALLEAEAARQARLHRQQEEQAAAREAAELADRQQQWTAIVGLCSKLSFIAEQVAEDRRVRQLRALRKEAAVKIASWYKKLLLRRRQRELVEFLQRLKRLIRPYLARQKELLRQRAAMRLVHFLQFAESSNMAVVGARKLKTSVDLLQSHWRNALLIRNLQRAALLNQLTRYERELVSANRRQERLVQTQLFRMGKAVNILEPDLGVGLSAAGVAAGGAAAGAAGGRSGASRGSTMLPRSAAASPVPEDSVAPSTPAGGGGGGLERTNTDISHATRASMGAHSVYDRSRQPSRKALLPSFGEAGGEEQDQVLATHRELVHKEIRERVVSEFLTSARRQHCALLERHSAAKQLYAARKPIEDMRQKMLRDAGLHVEPELAPPVLPRMRLLHPRATLRELLRTAIAANQARLRAAAEDGQGEAAGTPGGGAGGSGVAWADQPGGAGGGSRQLAHGASRRAIGRRSPSRAARGGGPGSTSILVRSTTGAQGQGAGAGVRREPSAASSSGASRTRGGRGK